MGNFRREFRASAPCRVPEHYPHELLAWHLLPPSRPQAIASIETILGGECVTRESSTRAM